MQPAIRVAVVSEDRMLREVVAASLDGRERIQVGLDGGAGQEAPDVILIDAGSDARLGVSQTWEARERWPEARLVVFGLDREDDGVVDFVEAGAQGYVLKGASPEDLQRVVREVHAGRTPCSPRVIASVLARVQELSRMLPDEPLHLTEPLTNREREILELLALGLGNKEIGRRLHITVQTV
ncbi:MAG TPA: response regulator transcription factor, partial [Thermoanaerobaculia bacterium]|nr:response regulator transcription factor [Thermoanaerobaculia bacterium]